MPELVAAAGATESAERIATAPLHLATSALCCTACDRSSALWSRDAGNGAHGAIPRVRVGAQSGDAAGARCTRWRRVAHCAAEAGGSALARDRCMRAEN